MCCRGIRRAVVKSAFGLWCAWALQWVAVGAAEAKVRTCVQVSAPEGEDRAAFRQLVEVELDRHVSHAAVDSDCRSFVLVEWLAIAGSGYLTARVNAQVPVRVSIGERELAAALTELLTILLHNDPVVLKGPRQRSWLGSRLRALKRGHTLYRLELAEVGAWVDGGVQSLPGLSFAVGREIVQWEVQFRTLGASALGQHSSELRLTQIFSAEVGARYFSAPSRSTSFFYGAALGLSHQRFRGPSSLNDGSLDSGFATVPAVVAEIGIELFRTTSTRLNLNGSFSAPLLKSVDIDTGVMDAWVPSAAIRVGMAL